MFIGYTSKTKGKSSGLMDEMILTRVIGHLRILGLGSEWRIEGGHEQREFKNPLL